MATRIVEWKKPYTWGKAIEIDENKVISLRLRDENNLIIYDAWDNEIYVDLQLPDEITPTDAFPVWITTGRVIVDNGWDVQGTIIVAKTTSGDNIKILYADDGKLYMDNGTWSFKQIYFKADVDLIVDSLQAQIDVLSGLGKFLSLWDCATGEPISFPLETPYEYSTWDWYMINNIDNTTNYRPSWTEYDETASSTVETDWVNIWDVYIYDGTVWLLQKNAWWGWGSVTFAQILWQPTDNTNLATALNAKQDTLTAWTNIQISNNVISATWWSDIVYATQAEYNALPSSKLTDGKHYVIYSTSWWGWWQPWANTLVYLTLDGNTTDTSGNGRDGTLNFSWYTYEYLSWNSWQQFIKMVWNNSMNDCISWTYSSTALWSWDRTISVWIKFYTLGWVDVISAVSPFYLWTRNGGDNWGWFGMFNFQGTQNPASYIWILRYWSDPNNPSYSSYDYNWHLYTVTYNDTNKAKIYVDWQQVAMTWDGNSSFNTTSTDYQLWPIRTDAAWMTIGYSNFIIENSERTAQEVSDYFDLTKWDYWIS